MSNASRVKRLQEKLNIFDKKELIEYMVSLVVLKDKSFEQSQETLAGYLNAWCNGTMNAIQGKKFLGQFTYQDKPRVVELLKNLYDKTQKEIMDKPNAGCGLLWVFLIEKENGDFVLKKQK